MSGAINPVQSLVETALSFARSKKAQNGLIEDLERGAESSSLVALRTSLNALTLPDLGLATTWEHCFQPNTISLINVYPRKALWIGIFCMTQGARFPLHDHPDMIGMTRLFQGRIAYRSMDILSCSLDVSTAQVLTSGEVQDSALLWLTPNRGNIHEIEALQDSVLLDLFLPNYSASRVCTYFQEAQTLGDQVTLKRFAQPDIRCQELPYTGLPVN